MTYITQQLQCLAQAVIIVGVIIKDNKDFVIHEFQHFSKQENHNFQTNLIPDPYK